MRFSSVFQFHAPSAQARPEETPVRKELPPATLPAQDLNPDTHYLGNRPRSKGMVEKCTFCIQRTRKGLYPACLEVCPTGSRKFGNLMDPHSEIRYVLEHKRVFLFKEDFNTKPKFFYFYGV